MRLSKWLYYLSSIPTILLRMKDLPRVIATFLGLTRQPFVLRLRTGERFKVRAAMDIWIIKESVLDRDYERHSVVIQDGWTVIDIGAGLGDFAVSVARRNRHSTVYAYEPFPESIDLLRENIALNIVENVRVLPYAIGAQTGPVRMEISSGVAVMHSTADLPDDLKPTGTSDQVIQVQGITLDDAVAELGIERVDYLKIDCEGGEYDILFNASPETLARIKHICLEYHDGWTVYNHPDLIAFFERHGFSVTRYPNPSRREIGLIYAVNPALP